MSSSNGESPAGPTPGQITATIELLGDDHGPLVAAARDRLLRWGDVVVPQLCAGAEAESVRLRSRCRALLRSFEVRAALARFARLRLGRSGRGSAAPLLDGAVLLAKMVRTFVPDATELAVVLKREANELRAACAGRSLPTCARLLAERLHDKLGLRGADPTRVDLDQSLVDRVLATRLGSPVALSLIYLIVARWAGMSVAGVAMPDHFLVRLHGTRPVLVDPFHAGRTITKADCTRYLRAHGHEQVRDQLNDLGDREMLIHYLRSLRVAAATRPLPETQQTLGHALALLETS
ncbi:MAG: transglutaminase family protein [Planctomycetes bacterium]|nr:transglutaminase family protein [Planctomycetota bacterium]